MKYVRFSYQGLANNIPKLKDCYRNKQPAGKHFSFASFFFGQTSSRILLEVVKLRPRRNQLIRPRLWSRQRHTPIS